MADSTTTAAIQQLHGTLVEANKRHDPRSDGGRQAAIMALIGVFEFIESIDDLRGQHLATPLSALGEALVSLDRGSLPPMLEPKQMPGGRRPETANRQFVKSAAAATMTLLMTVGHRRENAAKQVANVLRRGNVALDGRRLLDWRSVASWRSQLKRKARTPAKQAFGAIMMYNFTIAQHEAMSAGWPGELSKAVRTRCMLTVLSRMIAHRGGA